MKKIILFSLVLCFVYLPHAVANTPAMVERHIFTPESDLKSSSRGAQKSIMTQKLEKELSFTGIITTSQEKWVMIREKRKRGQEEVKGLLKEGEEINGMLIKEIGSNFIILSEQGKEIRLNLYYGSKNRPTPPPPEPKSPAASTAKNKRGATPAVSKTGVKKSATPEAKGSGKLTKPATGRTAGRPEKLFGREGLHRQVTPLLRP